MKYSMLLILIVTLVTVTSCIRTKQSPQGFSLPEGNVAAGEVVFRKYQCLSCHTLEGITQPGLEQGITVPVKLGGESHVVKTYAALVSAVINPSHKIAKGYPRNLLLKDGKSKMPIFNDVMTVTELTDLVTFLQPYYTLAPYRKTEYIVYP